MGATGAFFASFFVFFFSLFSFRVKLEAYGTSFVLCPRKLSEMNKFSPPLSSLTIQRDNRNSRYFCVEQNRTADNLLNLKKKEFLLRSATCFVEAQDKTTTTVAKSRF
jgi:hypothetical protein